MGVPEHFSKEEALEFDDMRFGLLSVFSLPHDHFTRDEAIETLFKEGIKAEWPSEIENMFKIPEDFLTKKIASQHFRLKLEDFEFSFMRETKKASKKFSSLADVILTFYPNIGIASLLLNFKLGKCIVDDLIFLQNSIYGKTKINVVLPNPLDNFSGKCTLEQITRKYIDFVLSAFNCFKEDIKIVNSRIVEICNLSNNQFNFPEELVEKIPKQLYGLLTGDEGWRFVPISIAENRMRSQWRTRNFLNVIAFSDCVVFINFEQCKMHEKYIASQTRVHEKYGHKINEYFTFSTEIAGLNHGPLLLLENASVQLYIINQITDKVLESRPKSIKDILKLREKLIDAIYKLSYIRIPEINLLGLNIQNAMHISEGIIEVKKKLQEVENDLLIKYNQKTNLLIIILAVISLGVGVFTILLETGLLNQFLRALGF